MLPSESDMPMRSVEASTSAWNCRRSVVAAPSADADHVAVDAEGAHAPDHRHHPA